MKLRWATRLAAVILVGLTWAFLFLRMGQLEWIYNGEPRPVAEAPPDPNPIPLPSDPAVNPPIVREPPSEDAEQAPEGIKNAGKLRPYVLFEALGFESRFFLLAHLAAIVLVIGSFFLPLGRSRRSPFQTPA